MATKRPPDAIIEMAEANKVAAEMARQYGVDGADVPRLAKMLAFDAVATDPALAFRRQADKQSAHRVIVAFVETDETVTEATLAHVRSQSALWQLRLRLAEGHLARALRDSAEVPR